MVRSFQAGLPNLYTENAEAEVTKLVKLGSAVPCNNFAQMNVPSQVDVSLFRHDSCWEEPLLKVVQVERVSKYFHPVTIDECRQRSIPGCPMDSTANVHICLHVPNGENKHYYEGNVCGGRDQPLLQWKAPNRVWADLSLDHVNRQSMNADIFWPSTQRSDEFSRSLFS